MTEADAWPDRRTPVLLSAHAEDLIGTDAAAILRYLDSRPDVSAVDVAATLLSTRRLRRHRAVVRAADRDELVASLRALAEGADHPLVTRAQSGAPASGSSARIAFVFPGQGSQWPSMGVQAYDRLPVYRAEVDKCAAEFQAAGAASPLDYLLAASDSGAVTNDFSQVQIQGAQFVHGVALARVWRSCGVLPDITVGHSLGEIGAAYVAGSITLPEAVAVVIARATVLDRLTGPYRVAVLGITPDEASNVIAEIPGWLELSVVNSRTSVAVSGETDAVAAAVATVAGRGSFAKEIEMWFPAHTTALDAARTELESLLPAAQFSESPVQFIGSATAHVVEAGTGFTDYWYSNLRSTVRFDRAIEMAARRGARIFVELSAHPALLFAMGDLLDDAAEFPGGPMVMVGSGRRDEPIAERLSANIVSVAMADPGYRWADLPNRAPAPLRDFPFAPMRAEHLWATPQPLPPVAGLTVRVEHWEELSRRTAPAGQRRVAVLDLAAGQGPAAALRRAVDEVAGATGAAPADADMLVVVAPVSDHVDALPASEALSRSIDEGLLGYVGAITTDTRDVWLVTVGGEQTGGEQQRPRAEAAALAAMHRSLGYEHPDQTFGHLDLPPTNLDPATAASAITAMLGDADDIALRDNISGPTVWRRGMRDDGSESRAWTAESGTFDEVVITGGTGAVGLHFARYLAARGARRIVLLSRSGLDDGQVAALAAHGAEILTPRCDLTDPAQIAATVAELAIGPASLVIHAAASATIAPGNELSGAKVRDTFAAKVSGLANLAAAWPMRPDARIMLCSSVSGLWGGYGHAAYSAANRLLDALGGQLRAEGRHCTSMRWGLWPGDGIIDSGEISRVERSGLRAMAPDPAVEAGLRDYPADPLVFTADAERLQTFLRADARPEPVSETAEEPDSDAPGATGAMRIALGSVLKLADTTGLDLDTSLLDLGVDSLLAIDLRKKLKKATGRSVPLATILGGATATELIEHLERPEKEAFSRD
ncbi:MULTISPECIES: mycobactin polyketide synthase MbtD [unclassified Mycolicibacterium]|uniref:mycobactin polyketide synthase MbtD n=1 Tax=unclassified Mycolicibacterium TaxID=2636767 RepID=UPI0012DEDA35|nr:MULTISPECIES: mycobactin polyketide synthase MbtD [unclassified Mycolicibacterium]MUL83653.1 SDR family NAD(P)-dependent oxidoreductase [Mycolicibacterium sp. CBMA 329]MUL90644.1 SDR family NAD(P)-dependent oxidoreductase [Mycolicibacterium sp. CBMA 331]MUM00613.1 SDR family NAD(P)-dependent oxidoreductase [Mycolicibacterium sp. CBMA 334]MUM28404.1 SDR family NAD(P)-dependent oxidoreductase [Mycolicibacterium sp. CBMA 295]MUM41588.1 SDR family NAD(P)-dependent oxidoreductase [Mycolicibacter